MKTAPSWPTAATFPVPRRRREAGPIRGKAPACGGSNTGLGLIQRQVRPSPPGSLNPSNAWAIHRLSNIHPAGKPMQVACYGYRYMDSLNGRWETRDPLSEESFKNSIHAQA